MSRPTGDRLERFGRSLAALELSNPEAVDGMLIGMPIAIGAARAAGDDRLLETWEAYRDLLLAVRIEIDALTLTDEERAQLAEAPTPTARGEAALRAARIGLGLED